MQTFLPFPDLARSASVLDRQRLGKQRVETLQILNALTGNSKGWHNHPATRMWAGFEAGLACYGVAVCDEWISRGYNDTCRDKITALVSGEQVDLPPWFGDEEFHQAHRSNLLRKNREHYAPLFEVNLPDDLPYVWPALESTS